MHVLAVYPRLSTQGPSPRWNFWSSYHSGPGFGLQEQSMAHMLWCARYWQPLQDWDTGPEGLGLCRRASPHQSKAWPSSSSRHMPEIFWVHSPSSLSKYLMRNLANYFPLYLLVDTLLLITFILKFYIWNLAFDGIWWGWQGSLFELVWLLRTSIWMKL